MVKSHRDLDVWNLSIDLVKVVYKITRHFPKDEIYGLTSQIKRAVISIPSNISESASRQSHKEFIQFLYIALGSSSEVETQLIIAKELEFVTAKEIEILFEKIDRIKRMLNGLINHQKCKEK